MKKLLIMRHAKSDWSNSAQSDFERPLNSRGKKAAPYMGQLLLKRKMVPDLIVTSAAKRAQETTDAVAEVCLLPESKIVRTEMLYEGYITEVVDVIKEVDDSVNTLMVVGHNPTWTNLVAHLSGEYTEVKTAEICVLEFPGDSWSEISKGACTFGEQLEPKNNND